jgi:aspartyl-tRNA(Asn)/glutamyl-tRNA(Gln) amidotransferase subunit A
MTEKLIHLSVAQLKTGLEKKQFSATEITNSYSHAIEEATELNCYITPNLDHALEAAKASDLRRQKGELLSALDGIPIAVKDLFCTKNIRTTAGSKMLENFFPPYESTVTERCFQQGLIHLGKTNMDEFAMGSSNNTSYFGPVTNPWREEKNNNNHPLVPGGSSGGSAAAVAAHLCAGALGSDTGGSIRQPAAFCGIVGIKPTYGRCSRYGMVAFASSLDQAGIFARTVEDAALLLEPIMGHDPRDSTSSIVEPAHLTTMLTANRDLKGLKIGIPLEYKVEGMPSDIQQLWDQSAQWLAARGAEIIPVQLPHTAHALATYYIVAPAEASSNLARYDGIRYGLRVYQEGMSLDELYEATRNEGFGEEVKRRIMIGTYVLSAGYYDAYYIKAQHVRALIKQDFENAFKKVDLLLTPTTPSPAFGLHDTITDPVQMYLNDIFTIPASLAGLPALSVPAGFSHNHLPLGMHLIGKAFDESTLLRTALVIEEEAQFSKFVAQDGYWRHKKVNG